MKKFLIVGFGSIGKRYYKIMNDLFKKKNVIDVIDNNPMTLKEIKHINILKNISAIQENFYDAAFVLTPSNIRLEIIKPLVQRGIKYFFIEKPLAIELKKAKQIHSYLDKNSCFAHVSCNLRFHKAIQIIKKKLSSKLLGKIYYARSTFSHFLPYWRENVDYRKGYNAKKKLGGNIFIDAIHEPDYLLWLFGDGKTKNFYSTNTKNLEIESDDLSCYMIAHTSGVISEIFVDYLRNDKFRGVEIVGEHGTLIWKSSGKNPELVEILMKKKGNTKKIFADNNYDSNDQYVNQIKYFIKLINKKNVFMNSPKDAIKTLSIVTNESQKTKIIKFK